MNGYEIRIPFKIRNLETEKVLDERAELSLTAENDADAAHKVEVALQRILDIGEPESADPPHVIHGACAGCGRHGSSIETIPNGEVALHWVVRGVWVCIECYKEDKRGLQPLNRGPHQMLSNQPDRLSFASQFLASADARASTVIDNTPEAWTTDGGTSEPHTVPTHDLTIHLTKAFRARLDEAARREETTPETLAAIAIMDRVEGWRGTSHSAEPRSVEPRSVEPRSVEAQAQKAQKIGESRGHELTCVVCNTHFSIAAYGDGACPCGQVYAYEEGHTPKLSEAQIAALNVQRRGRVDTRYRTSEGPPLRYHQLHELAKWKHEFSCLHCTSKLEVEAKDLKFVSDQRDGDSYQFRCPVCGTIGWIEAGTVPRGLVPP